MPETKELHFFNNESKVDWIDYSRYEKHFAGRKPLQICGEATPAYIYWPNSIERIAAYNADIRLIIILRNPIERAHSHWLMEYTMGREWLDFSEAIRDGRSRVVNDPKSHLGHHKNFSYVERGFYALQLARVYAHFPKDHVLVLLHDGMREDPEGFLARIASFLDIATIDDASLRQYFSPYRREADLGPIDPRDIAYLSSIFRDDVHALQQVIEDDVPGWAIA